MRHVPLPTEEAERLAALRRLELLDTPPEEVFDALTRVASATLGVPIAVLSLVDESRQWFKSQVGLDVTETPREVAFCAHAIAGDGTFVVDDALADDRFVDNPLVTGGPHIRAYAGVPLRTRDGHALGTLCAIDRQPRRFTARELALLQDLAGIARREILQREAASRDEGSHALHAATFAQAALGIGVLDLDGRWLRVNPALCALLGRTEGELLATSLVEATHPDDRTTQAAFVARLRAPGPRNDSPDRRYLRPDGGVVRANLAASRVANAAGVPQYAVAVMEDTTARHEAEQALRALAADLETRVAERTTEVAEREADLRAVLTNALEAYVCIDTDGRVVEWNPQAERTFGWSRDEALGRSLDTLIVPPAFRERHRAGMARLAATGTARVLDQRLELPALRRDGTEFPCELSISRIASPSRGVLYGAFLHDITRRRQHEQRLADTLDQLAAVNRQQRLMLDNELVGIVQVEHRRVVWVNRAFGQLLGYAPEELTGLPTRALYPSDEAYRTLGEAAREATSAGRSFRAQSEMVRKDGSRIWADISGARLSDDGSASLWMTLDITAMKQHQDRVEALAYHDTLTGLPNRALLMDRLTQALAAAGRSGDQVAVCFGDLNGFKAVNDTHGHDAGDVLLQAVGRRLAASVRAHDTVARLGGDEFVLVLAGLASDAEREAVLARAMAAVAAPVELPGGAQVAVTMAFGTAVARLQEADAAGLIARADAAMYVAKRRDRAAAVS